MPGEEPNGVTKYAHGNVGLNFSKENRTEVRDLGIICIKVTNDWLSELC